MRYYKLNDEVFAYDDKQVEQGYSNGKIEMTAEEIEAHVNPPLTPTQIIAQKWAEIDRQIAALTVTTAAGNTFAANDVAMGYIARKRDAMKGTDTIMWYEDWASFEVTKIELEEAYLLADRTGQEIRDNIFGAAKLTKTVQI